jgi:hypothetical protein
MRAWWDRNWGRCFAWSMFAWAVLVVLGVGIAGIAGSGAPRQACDAGYVMVTKYGGGRACVPGYVP